MVIVLVVTVVVGWFTPVLGVRSTEVAGAKALSQQRVLSVADVPMGTPMLRVDTDEVQRRLARVPSIASSNVSLVWPSTMVVEITERTPDVVIETPHGPRLVDAAGVAFPSTGPLPPDLPRIRMSSTDPRALDAAVTVIGELPPQLRREVTEIVVHGPFDIRLSLLGQREVQWGGTDKSEQKSRILPPLLTRPATTYDVSSPELPTTKG